MKKLLCTLGVSILVSVPLQAHATKQFTDVPNSHYAAEAIEWAASQEIITSSTNKFNPTQKVTEAQFLKMYVEFFGHQLITKDDKPGTWSDTYYDGLILYDLPLKGYSDQSARNKSITRGQVAQLIAHAHGKSDDLESAVQYMIESGISTGQNSNATNRLEQYGATNTLTRAQAVTLLHRIDNSLGAQLSSKRTNVLQETETILSKYNLGSTVTANMMSNDKNNFEIKFTINEDEIIGGYIGGSTQAFENIAIGQIYKDSELIEKNGKIIEILTDNLDGSKVLGIYWHYNYKEAKQAIRLMEKDTSAQKQIDEEKLYIELLNNTRAQNNVAPVKEESNLMQVARKHSNDMDVNNYFSHTSLNGDSPGTRIKATGLQCKTWGEIIAKGQQTVFHAHNSWMNSSGHRRISLDPVYEEVGIGVDHKLYTAVFFTGW